MQIDSDLDMEPPYMCISRFGAFASKTMHGPSDLREMLRYIGISVGADHFRFRDICNWCRVSIIGPSEFICFFSLFSVTIMCFFVLGVGFFQSEIASEL